MFRGTGLSPAHMLRRFATVASAPGPAAVAKSAAVRGSMLTVEWADGTRHDFHGIWLRDHVRARAAARTPPL